MEISRRDLLLATTAAMLSKTALAAEWPQKPLKLTIGYTPGGAADAAARPLLAAMERALGQPVVMDYRPGAGGATAAEFISRSAPDGYGLHLIEGSVFTAMPSLRKLSFDPVRSLQPLGLASQSATIVVAHPSLRVSTLAELIQLANSQPGRLTYGTSGIGGINHLSAEYFQSLSDTKLTHDPYKGGAQAMTDLVGGQIQLLFSSLSPAVPFVRDGKIIALGVTTLTRTSSLPQVPTIAEQGFPGFEAATWLGIAAARPLPEAVAQRIARAVAVTVATPSVQAELRANGFEPMPGGPAEMEQRIVADTAKWTRTIRDAKITVE